VVFLEENSGGGGDLEDRGETVVEGGSGNFLEENSGGRR